MLENFFTYIKNYFAFSQVAVKKPLFCPPRTFNAAFEELRNDTTLKVTSYKLYPDERKTTAVKISIDKVNLQSRKKYLFSAWVKDKEYLKFREDDYDFLLEKVFEEVSKQDDKKKKKNLKELNIEFSTYSNEEQEYYIDTIYQNKPEKLFSFRDTVLSGQTTLYIRSYYTSLLKHFFQFCTYDMLVKYEEEISLDKKTVVIFTMLI